MVLDALGRQTATPERFEVIVVCDGCGDGTEQMCRDLKVRFPLRVISQPQAGPASARNRALAEAAGEVIIFLDDDVVPAPELVEEHLSVHRDDHRVVLIGPLLAPPDFDLEPWTRWEASMLVGQYRDIERGKWAATPRQFYTGNASVRREHVLAAGGFDATYHRAEDVELAYRLQRLNLVFKFSPAAKGWHYARRSLASWLSIARSYGVADVKMYRDGRLMTLQAMAREFRWRRRRLQQLARACVGRSVALRPVIAGTLFAARVAGWLSLRRQAEGGYSVVFNLCYWNGVSDELGGRRAFWELIRAEDPNYVP